MTDYHAMFEAWEHHTPDMRIKIVKDIAFLEHLYQAFKARLLSETGDK